MLGRLRNEPAEGLGLRQSGLASLGLGFCSSGALLGLGRRFAPRTSCLLGFASGWAFGCFGFIPCPARFARLAWSCAAPTAFWLAAPSLRDLGLDRTHAESLFARSPRVAPSPELLGIAGEEGGWVSLRVLGFLLGCGFGSCREGCLGSMRGFGLLGFVLPCGAINGAGRKERRAEKESG
jgi:hypothetical protein